MDPPCQGFSVIGKSRTDDPRNALFAHFFRVVPKCALAFLSLRTFRGFFHDKNAVVLAKAMKRVERDYIVLPPLLINASDVGAPTVRTRAFFVGYLRTSDFSLQEKDFAPSRHVKRTLR